MSGKTKRMGQIKQILQLHQQGYGKKTIVKSLGISRKTVRAVLNKVEAGGWLLEELLSLEDPALESRLYAGNAAFTEEKFNQLKDRLDYYAAELERPHVTKRLLWEEYRQQFPDGYSHSQFQHHLLQHVRTKNTTMVLEHKPADKLMIDFAGKTTSYVDPQTGEIITCQLFVACLPYSSYFFAMAVPTQKLEDFIHALVSCIAFVGGVTSLLVPDNMKTAIAKASRYEPELNQALEDLANHYGFAVMPARVAHPQDKGAVEGHVKIAYAQIYARLRNRQFFSIADLNAAIKECVLKVNQTRMQNKPYSREEKFLADERPLLKSVPSELFQIKHYREYTVAKNCHILLMEDKHHYSVPHTYRGKKVKVIYTRSLVEIYYQGQRIACHQRDRAPGRYTYIKEHLASQQQQYLNLSYQYYLDQAVSISDKLKSVFAQRFEQDIPPEILYKSCNGWLALCKKTDKATVDKACQIALEVGNYSYKFFENLIKNKMTNLITEKPSTVPLPRHANVRGKDYYQQQLNINL